VGVRNQGQAEDRSMPKQDSWTSLGRREVSHDHEKDHADSSIFKPQDGWGSMRKCKELERLDLDSDWDGGSIRFRESEWPRDISLNGHSSSMYKHCTNCTCVLDLFLAPKVLETS
jgi:hypothetical protein